MRALFALGAIVFGVSATTSANDLSRDEEVVFFPTFSVYDPAAPNTTLFVRGWIFEPEADSVTRKAAVAGAAKLLDLDDADATSRNFEQRIRLFLVDNETNQQVVIRLGPSEVALGNSEANGHMRANLTLKSADLAKIITRHGREAPTLEYRAVAPKGDARTFPGRVFLLPPSGWSVISDIDDTTKVSNVADKVELMRNTFTRDFQPVAGMPDAYRRWANEGAAFHYVTTSPWQLYPPLEKFAVDSRYPRGSYHMRHFRLQDGSALDLLAAPDRFKTGTIEEILKACPNRKFVLVGDSGEHDPEIYGDLARKYSDRLRLIAIRSLTDETIADNRLSAAFRDIPAERLLLFREPTELPALKTLGD